MNRRSLSTSNFERFTPEEIRKRKTRKFLRTSGITIGAVILGILILSQIGTIMYKRDHRAVYSKPDTERLLHEAADYVNQNCPMNVGSGIIMLNATVMPNKTLTYNYSISEFTVSELQSINLDLQADKPLIINGIISNPDIKALREAEVTFVYQYYDRNMVFYDKVTITSEEYSE